jgi:hypothetical protein
MIDGGNGKLTPASAGKLVIVDLAAPAAVPVPMAGKRRGLPRPCPALRHGTAETGESMRKTDKKLSLTI